MTRTRIGTLIATALLIGVAGPLVTTGAAAASPAPHCWLTQGPATPQPDNPGRRQVVVESNCSGDIYLQLSNNFPVWDPGGHVTPEAPMVFRDIWLSDKVGAAYWA